VKRENGKIKEKIKMNVKKVGIIVGEKKEIKEEIMKRKNIEKKKDSEVEEMKGRMKE
jgi:hypothetical protein